MVLMPERIQLSRTKGWRKPENTIVVARPSRWGNPFRSDDPAEAVDRYIYWLWEDPTSPSIVSIIDELAGHNLACWCALEDADGKRVPCHADVLLGISNPAWKP